MRKPRALRPGDRVAVVAPASPFKRDEFEAGIAEIRAFGFDPVYDDSVFARHGYVAGTPDVRVSAFMRAWEDPSIAALVAARGGYGSVQMLPLLDRQVISRNAKAFIGYSDNTSILSWLTLQCGIVSFHGPMIEGRFARGADGYDRDTFTRCLCAAEPAGEIAHPQVSVLAPGEADGMLLGGTLTQLMASLGTPFAFAPPDGLRAVSRRGRRAPVPHRSAADAIAAERPARPGLRRHLRRDAAMRRARRQSDGARRHRRSHGGISRSGPFRLALRTHRWCRR